MTASRHGPKITEAEAVKLEAARQRMLARQKLITSMIHNNEQQLKNESARGGAEIERAVARRDAAAPGAGAAAKAALAEVEEKLAALNVERERLVREREFLNESLLEYESGPTDGNQRAGHA
jgi:hypothetical protein